jgi:hypothetical protein
MKRRENLAKAIYDLGKLVFAALVLGPIVSPEAFSIPRVIAGVFFTALAFVIGFWVDRGGD